MHPIIKSKATFEGLKSSISWILTFSLLGKPFPSDYICGFEGDISPELCTWWHQASLGLPFGKKKYFLNQENLNDPFISSYEKFGLNDKTSFRDSIIKAEQTWDLIYDELINYAE